MFSIYLNPSKYVKGKEYDQEIKRYIKFFKSAEPNKGIDQVLMNGEKEIHNEKDKIEPKIHKVNKVSEIKYKNKLSGKHTVLFLGTEIFYTFLLWLFILIIF